MSRFIPLLCAAIPELVKDAHAAMSVGLECSGGATKKEKNMQAQKTRKIKNK